MMKLISVNIGQERNLQNGTKLEITGIFKVSTSEPARVTANGLAGDFIADAKHHGGPDQAVYVYGQVDYAWWANELGREVPPGTFGENLTISDLESSTFSIGDCLHLGSVILEVSAPRIPCGTLAARMGDQKFIKRFRQAERPGLYCRVIQQGVIQVGDDVMIQRYKEEKVSVVDVFRGYYEKNKNEALLRRQLQAPICIRARNELEHELQNLLNQK